MWYGRRLGPAVRQRARCGKGIPIAQIGNGQPAVGDRGSNEAAGGDIEGAAALGRAIPLQTAAVGARRERQAAPLASRRCRGHGAVSRRSAAARITASTPTPTPGRPRRDGADTSAARRCEFSIVAVFSVRVTSRPLSSSHSRPARSIRANGRSLSQPNRSIACQPSAAATAQNGLSKNSPTSSTKRRQRPGGTSRGGRPGSSRVNPCAHGRGSCPQTRLSRRSARPQPTLRARDRAAKAAPRAALSVVHFAQNVQKLARTGNFEHSEHSEQRAAALRCRCAARRAAGASGSSRRLPQPGRHLPVAARPSGTGPRRRPYPPGIGERMHRLGAALGIAQPGPARPLIHRPLVER